MSLHIDDAEFAQHQERQTSVCRAAALVLSMLAGLPAAPAAHAAPPAVTSLYPAGVQRGQPVVVTLNGKPGETAPQVWCDRADVTVAAGEKPNLITVTAAAEAPPGIAWLRFFNAEGAGELRPLFVGVLPEVLEQEPNNKLDEARRIESLPVTLNGVLHKGGEVDTCAVTLEAGQMLIASMEAHRALGSPMDGVLQIVSSSGFIVSQNDDDRGFDPQITFQAPQPGVYYVRTFAFPAEPNSSIAFAGGEGYVYRLMLTTGPLVDHVVPLAVAAAAPAPAQPAGINLPEDAPAVTPLVNTGTAALPMPWPATLLAHRLPIVPHPVLVEAAPGEMPQLLEPPVCITGRIAATAETDVYRFSGAKGKKLRFAVEARRFDSPLDPLLRLIGPDGKPVKEQDDEGRRQFDLDFVQELPVDGEYRLEITDRFRTGGPRHAYLLTVEEAVADFALTLAADRFTLKPGAALEIPVTVERRQGFKEEITLTVEGLPAGVTVGEAKSLPEGDTAKSVKLKLETDGSAAFNGPIRITGTAGEQLKTADAPIAALPDRTSAVWLTVVSKDE